MGEWSTISFADAVSVNPTVALKRGNVYPFVEMAAVDPGARSVCESEHREFTGGGSRFAPGDTLMARITPCLENGKIAMFRPRVDGGAGFGSTEFIVIRGREGVTTDDYAYYLTMWPDFRQFAIGQMTGSSGRQRVPAETLAGFEVAVPPLPTQRRIAHILGALDDKIELNRRMNATLETMARALFQSWFVDFDPVRAKLDGRKPTGIDKAISALFPVTFQESPLGSIPQGWKLKTIEELAERVAIGPFGSDIKVCTFVSEGIPVVSGQHLRGIMLYDSEFNFVTVEHADHLKRSNVQRGDVIFTHAGNIGQVAYIPKTSRYERYIVSQRQFYMRCNRSLMSPFFIASYFKTPEGQHRLLANTSSTGVPSISQPVTYLRQLKIVVPPLALMKVFDSTVATIHLKMTDNDYQSRTLAALRDSLLPKLLNGQLNATGKDNAP